MIFTVSTVRDTLANVQRFVAGNLAGGADHLVVFLDAADPPVRAFLEAHPHVTCVRTDRSWWLGGRPAKLNGRQRINANVVRLVLSTLPEAEWLFHIDGDEIVQLDREVLAAVPADVEAVRLSPLEAVSRQHWEGEPTWFKRKLGKNELLMLCTLGVIARPHNRAYFHGHINGKSGMRPRLDRWLALHDIVDAHQNLLDSYRHDALRLLHYESFSGEEFVRKWTAMLQAGPDAGLRAARQPTARALRALVSKGLAEEQAAPYLMRIFERTTEDDFETLRGLGLLVHLDPRLGTHRPAPLPDGGREHIDALLARLSQEPKVLFHPSDKGEDRRALERATQGLPVRRDGGQGSA
ncbi:glycosyltransferase family 2 protein [Nocardioides sp. cx-173]|uniref:glycosyltransferase family 2 protein n=1 Tax=Nocardioides sp. cx-173 TaxID=2898796 RepID=UPI001E34F79A|nr:glycosyltransferase family 2 protein [Nocardioides sp. cx-173]MCD4523297.1 glycosyltransferase family 2 protein [Nocardioides sp. cx-173]UGB42362.1 glycosyltransferase family 2 protein [Nocardioides sp. cx-173]